MRPETKYYRHTLFLQDLIDESVLEVDAAQIDAGQIANEFFLAPRGLEGIDPKNLEKRFCFGLESGSGKFLSVSLGQFRKDQVPRHHFNALGQSMGPGMSIESSVNLQETDCFSVQSHGSATGTSFQLSAQTD